MRRPIRLALAALVGLLAPALTRPGSAGAEDEVLRLLLEAKDVPPARAFWFGLYMSGTKVGYLNVRSGRAGAGAEAPPINEIAMKFQLTAMGKKLDMEMTERSEYDSAPPFALRGARMRSVEGERVKEVEITRGDAGFTPKVTEDGATRTLPVVALDYTLADDLTIERWFQAPRAVGDRARTRSFSFEKLKVTIDTTTVLSRKEATVAGVRTAWFEAKSVDEDGTEGIVRVDSLGLPLSFVMGGLLEGRRETEEQAKKIEYGSDLFVFGMAKVDKPLGDAVHVTRLVLEAEGEGAAHLQAAPRQGVERDPSTGAVVVTVGEGLGDSTAEPKDVDESLAETVDYPTHLPQVVALASKAVGDAKTPKEKVARLVPFVADFVDDALVPEPVSVAEIIRTHRGDCSEHALLFVTLARAAGVPAREVAGLMYMGDGVQAFGGHAWAEVALDGRWVPVDPTWKETTLDAAHVTLDRASHAASIATLGRLKFHVRDEKRAP